MLCVVARKRISPKPVKAALAIAKGKLFEIERRINPALTTPMPARIERRRFSTEPKVATVQAAARAPRPIPPIIQP